jgi:DNA-binding FrmR family transcriptional regulator
MGKMDKEGILQRLKTVEGHIRGIERMVENDTYCIDVLRQIQAVQGALNKVGNQILDDHLHSCVITAVQGEDVGERERVLEELTEVFDMASKV